MSNKVIAVKLDADISSLKKAMSSAKSSVSNSMGTIKEGFSGFKSSGVGASNQVKDSFINSFAKIAVASEVLKSAFNIAKEIAEVSANAREIDATYSQVFGDMESEATKALNSIGKEANVLPTRLKAPFMQIASFAKTTGSSTADSLSIAERATMAAADSAAFYGGTVENSTDILQSFLKGNYENDAALGISSTETTRNAKANELYGQSFNDLSEAQKQLTSLAMVEEGNKLSGALGQASREGGEFANVLGNLTHSIDLLKGAVGEPFLDMLNGSMQKITDLIVPLIPKVGEFATALATGDWATIINMMKQLVSGGESLMGSFPVIGSILAGFGALMFQSFSVAPLNIFGKGMNVLGNAVLPMFGDKIGKVVGKMGGLFATLTGNLKGFGGKIAGFFGTVGGYTSDAVSKVTSALFKVIGVALKLLAPAVLLATVLVGMGVIYQQFGTQINEMAQLAITEAPKIIQGIIDGFVSKIPALILAGAELLVLLVEVINANLPVLVQGGIQILNSLITGLVQALPMLMASAITIITTLINSIITLVPALIMAGLAVLQGLIDGIMANLPLLMSSVSSIVDTLTSTLATYLPLIIDSGINILLSLIDGVVSMLPQLIPMAVTLISTIFSTLISNLPKIIDGGIKIVESLKNGLINNLPAIISGAVTLITNIASTIAKNLPTILQKGIELVGSLAGGLIRAVPALLSAGGQLLSKLWDKIKETDWLSLGADMVKGIAKGITGAIGSVLSAMGGVVDGALGWAKEKLGIKSPSRVMRDVIGKMIPQGIAVGVEKDSDIAVDSVGNLSQSLIDDVQHDMNRWNLQAQVSPMNVSSDDFRSSKSGSSTEMSVYKFELPVMLDGREIAKATAEFTQNELEKLKVRKDRLSGVRV